MAEKKVCESNDSLLSAFIRENEKEGIRVFVAGGSRGGNNPIYTKETYNLGKSIVKMGFKLDFGLSNSGIMGAVAKGVMDAWNEKNCPDKNPPIIGITTEEYFKLYDSNDEMIKHIDVIFAKTLEERKQRLLDADFVVFAPGGVGTLDELAYDCVAMQDGLLQKKPFILYNINGFFHHLLEFLKSMANKGFADPVPFIVVDNEFELEVAFELLKSKYGKCEKDKNKVYANARQLVYELPYFIKRREETKLDIVDIIREVCATRAFGDEREKSALDSDIETAYLEKEIERMYDRLAKTGRDTSVVSYKLSRLKRRKRKL